MYQAAAGSFAGWGGGAGNSGWLEKLGWLESVTPVNGELDVNRLGTSRLEVVEVVEVDRVGVVDFQLSSGLNMTGFYGDLG